MASVLLWYRLNAQYQRSKFYIRSLLDFQPLLIESPYLAIRMSDLSELTAVITSYVKRSELAFNTESLQPLIENYLTKLAHYLQQAELPPAIWQYSVPELGEGGACSLFGELAAEPYDLTAILQGQTAENTLALQKLAQISHFYQQHSGLDWFGIYQARSNVAAEPVLVKLAYYGAPSRAEFPLTAEFAAISNNSTVGLSGKARVINDVSGYLQQGGEYYTCDPKVQAEACLPLFDHSGTIVGIVDAEDFNKGVFTADALALLIAVCLTVPQFLPPLN